VYYEFKLDVGYYIFVFVLYTGCHYHIIIMGLNCSGLVTTPPT